MADGDLALNSETLGASLPQTPVSAQMRSRIAAGGCPVRLEHYTLAEWWARPDRPPTPDIEGPFSQLASLHARIPAAARCQGKLAPEPVGSPLFTSTPLVACWRYEPREHLRPLAKTRSLIPPSPLRDRVGYSDHDRFRGYFPVHFIPAYNLPVYASQRPLPDATQDSVRGCSLDGP
jgi:hypothetical protein